MKGYENKLKRKLVLKICSNFRSKRGWLKKRNGKTKGRLKTDLNLKRTCFKPTKGT